MLQEELELYWLNQLYHARRQLDCFESGKMTLRDKGVDRSDAYIASLRIVVASIKKMLAVCNDCGTLPIN